MGLTSKSRQHHKTTSSNCWSSTEYYHPSTIICIVTILVGGDLQLVSIEMKSGWSDIRHWPSRAEWRTNMLATLSDVCNKWNTCPSIQDVVLMAFEGDWRANKIKQGGNTLIWDVFFVGNGARPNYHPKKCGKGSAWQVAIIGCLWDQ